MGDIQKVKVSFHSGKGYAKHNNHYITKRDKGNIDHSVTPKNKIWTRVKGVTDIEEAERKVYEEFFMEELNQQNARYRKKGNYKYIRTMEEWMKAERHRPVENILQIGNMNCYIDPADLWDCYVEFTKWRKRKYGDHIILISAVMHVDEATPHIHERYVWYYIDDEGVMHTGMKKSMELAGIKLPDPDKPEGQYNYRKMTVDAECREKWQDIVEEKLKIYKDLELDRTVDQNRKASRIGHMGVDSWRNYQRALNRSMRLVNYCQAKEEELKTKEAEIKAEQDRLAKEAAALAQAAQQQDADRVAIAGRMIEIHEREEELAEMERTFTQRVDDAVKRREQAEEKRCRAWEDGHDENAYNPFRV